MASADDGKRSFIYEAKLDVYVSDSEPPSPPHVASADVQEVRFQNFDFRGRFITILRLRRLAFHKFPDVKIGSSLQPQQEKPVRFE